MMEWMCEFRSAMDFWVSGLRRILELGTWRREREVVSCGEGMELYSKKEQVSFKIWRCDMKEEHRKRCRKRCRNRYSKKC